MNYSKVGWSNKSAITQSDMVHMDEALYALAQESSKNINALGNLPYTSIQAGTYVFGTSSSEVDLAKDEGRYLKKRTIQFPKKFATKPIIVATANTSQPDKVSASVVNDKISEFDLVLEYDPRWPPGATNSSGGINKLSVNWIAIGN